MITLPADTRCWRAASCIAVCRAGGARLWCAVVLALAAIVLMAQLALAAEVQIQAPGVKITATNQGPCVHSASMAWDTRSAVNPRLMVVNGFVDTNDTHNTDVWYFTFSSATSGTWTLASPSPCAPLRDAMGAFDLPSRKMVFFGGGSASTNSFNDTFVCL